MLVRQLQAIRHVLFGGTVVIGIGLVFSISNNAYDARVYFFDVGQGDASLIALPNDVQVVIDGGPSDVIVGKLGKAMPFYDRTIEYMVLTHPHHDHVTGLIAVAKRYQIKTFIYNGVMRESDSVRALFEELSRQGTNVRIIAAAETLHFSDTTRLEVLFPDHALTPQEYEDYNDSSIVARFVVNEIPFLFMGDAPKEIERLLMKKNASLSATVLKVGHQGSKTSTDPAFLSMVDPDYGIIMVGKNSYGHPHYRTLHTLARAGVSILRTDQDGDIRFNVNGEKLNK